MRMLSTALVLAAASFAVPAVAGEAQKGRASVRYNDLNLSTEAGRAELSKRFEQAARDMCGVTGEAPRGSQQRYCYERTSKQLAQRAASIVETQAAGG